MPGSIFIMVNAKELRASERLKCAGAIARSRSGRLGLTDHTASRISLEKPAPRARGLRMAYAMVRCAISGRPQKVSSSIGQ